MKAEIPMSTCASGRVAWEGGSARAIRGSVTVDAGLRTLLER